ncbi:amidohydrolase family protein [Labedella phragmitis]|uniref:Amidohydrolase family protein n=1 Tax=Labedella phragmitis TaxID=2498849 RepID=A0A444PYL2_9MICO|nr:amidohydrolase family protein [Labedella phragmitis]RWZ52982.1 amidohydrolase family protein [Labedella phragmitis]
MSGDLTVLNALIFDGESAELVDGGVRIVDGSIVEIGDVTAGEDTIDARGAVVTPGLIDAHFHAYAISMITSRIENSYLSYLALAASHRLRDALRRGFTTVRDVAGGDAGLSAAIDRGLIPSPRYFWTGAALSQTGGHGDHRGAEDDLCFHGGHMCDLVDGVDALRVAVRSRFHHGAHAIKVMTSGGVASLTDPLRPAQYSAEEIRAVTDEAARRGSYVAAHSYSPESIRHSIENGVRSIEHGNLLDPGTAAAMAERNAVLVPTLAAYDAMDRRGDEVGLSPVSAAKNKEVLEAGKYAVGHALAAGVTVGFGSDLMGDLASDQLVGVRLQAEASSPLDVLRSLTSANAALLQRTDLGRLRDGALGDLVVWSGNPLEDISVISDESRGRTVVSRGRRVAAGG